jgi:serine/tyrosine/threonine adenylyltransferase
LNALGIPTTRALSLTLTPNTKALREMGHEPTAVVCRFAQTWLRIGTFDLPRARGDRATIRQLADYLGEHVFGGWDRLRPPPRDEGSREESAAGNVTTSEENAPKGIDEHSRSDAQTGGSANRLEDRRAVDGLHADEGISQANGTAEKEDTGEGVPTNRYAELYRHIARLNALTVAKWQAYAFTNGVLNTDNTSLFGLSIDFGPFAFLDDFDPDYTPNHDDHELRYSLKNQPSVIWWNLTRLGEALGELVGAGHHVDNPDFVAEGLRSETSPIGAEELIKNAESIIMQTGEEYKALFLAEYKRLMALRLGLKGLRESDYSDLFSSLLETMKDRELDYTHFFRRLSSVRAADVATAEKRMETAGRFFRKGIKDGDPPLGTMSEEDLRRPVAKWLGAWHGRIAQDWGAEAGADEEREAAMKRVNPKFIPRGWILDEIIQKVQDEQDHGALERCMTMALDPFAEEWKGDTEEQQRWCGDVPARKRQLTCSCSS